MLTITFVCHARIKTSEVLSEWYHMYFLYLISSISWQTAYSSWCASFEMASDEISGVAWRTLKPDVCLSRVNQYNGTVCNLGRTHVTSWLAFFLWPSLTAHSEFSSEQILPPRKSISKKSHRWQHHRVGPVKVPRVLCEIPYRRSRFNEIETYDCSICKVLGLVVAVTLSVLLAHR